VRAQINEKKMAARCKGEGEDWEEKNQEEREERGEAREGRVHRVKALPREISQRLTRW